MTRSRSAPLWVLTTYYNPAGYNRRRMNFKAFRRMLQQPLLVVELARDGRHELSDDDGEIVIRLTGEDRLWQKERLLNVGLEALPRHVEFAAWIDCDLVFPRRRMGRQGGEAPGEERRDAAALRPVASPAARRRSADVVARRLQRLHAAVFRRRRRQRAARVDFHETSFALRRRATRRISPAAIASSMATIVTAWPGRRRARRSKLAASTIAIIVGGGNSMHVLAAL